MWQLWARTASGSWTLLNSYTLEQEVWLNRDLIWIHNRDRVNKIDRSLHAVRV